MVGGKEERFALQAPGDRLHARLPEQSSAFGAAPAGLTIMVSGRLILPRPHQTAGSARSTDRKVVKPLFHSWDTCCGVTPSSGAISASLWP